MSRLLQNRLALLCFLLLQQTPAMGMESTKSIVDQLLTEDMRGVQSLSVVPEPAVVFIIHGALKEPKKPGAGHRKAHIAQVTTQTAANVSQIVLMLLQFFGRSHG